MYSHKDRFGRDITVGDYIIFANDVLDWGPALKFGKVKSFYEHGIMVICGSRVFSVLFTEKSTMILSEEMVVEFKLRGY